MSQEQTEKEKYCRKCAIFADSTAKARRHSAASRDQDSVITDFTSELKIGN
jgi:hypothetical protein